MATHRHTFTMTAERAAAAQAPLEQVLWARSEQLRARLRPLQQALRWLALGLCVLGVALTLWFAPPWRQPQFAWALVAFVAFIPVFGLLPVAEARLRRWTRARTGLAAEKMLAPVRAKVPYEIEYELDGHALRTVVPKLGLTYQLPLARVGLALSAEHIVCLFRRRLSPVPFRVLYAPSAQEREVLLGQLRAAGAVVVDVTSQTTG